MRHQLFERGSPAGILRPFAKLGEAQEDVMCNRLLFWWKILVDTFGGMCDRAMDAARIGIALEGEGVTGTPFPCFQQGMRE